MNISFFLFCLHIDTILLFKSRFLAGCIIFLTGFILILIAFISCILARNNQTKREKIPISKPIINGKIEQSISSSPVVRIITKESSTETDDYISKKLNKTEELNIETKTNHLILSDGYLEFYQPDAESGLIRPLTIRTDTSKHYTKNVSFNNRFLLPRSVNQ
jgi:ABC-type multidrug transport system fused ATPase/permease subunit